MAKTYTIFKFFLPTFGIDLRFSTDSWDYRPFNNPTTTIKTPLGVHYAKETDATGRVLMVFAGWFLFRAVWDSA